MGEEDGLAEVARTGLATGLAMGLPSGLMEEVEDTMEVVA